MVSSTKLILLPDLNYLVGPLEKPTKCGLTGFKSDVKLLLETVGNGGEEIKGVQESVLR